MKKEIKTGRCMRCGRVLKNPQAILIGLGSTCQKKMGFTTKTESYFLFKSLIK